MARAGSELPTVVRVTWQFSNEEMLFVYESPHQKWEHEHERQQPPVRPEREGGACKIDERARIHRVAHDGVRSARDDALPFGNANRGRRERVLSIDACDQQEADDEEHVASDDGGERAEPGRAASDRR